MFLPVDTAVWLTCLPVDSAVLITNVPVDTAVFTQTYPVDTAVYGILLPVDSAVNDCRTTGRLGGFFELLPVDTAVCTGRDGGFCPPATGRHGGLYRSTRRKYPENVVFLAICPRALLLIFNLLNIFLKESKKQHQGQEVPVDTAGFWRGECVYSRSVWPRG